MSKGALQGGVNVLQNLLETDTLRTYQASINLLLDIVENKIGEKVLVKDKDGTSHVEDIGCKVADRIKAAAELSKMNLNKMLPDMKASPKLTASEETAKAMTEAFIELGRIHAEKKLKETAIDITPRKKEGNA